MYYSLNAAHNPIGNKGCKYLTKANMPNLRSLRIGKYKIIKDLLESKMKELLIYQSINGIFCKD
jgi:hypothetical protein